MIKLSLIIPYHNEPEDQLNRLIYSILSQQNIDFNDIEIVISNNSENPLTPSFITQQNYPAALSVSYYITSNNLTGPNRQNGIINSKGIYFTLLDSDDLLSDAYVLKDILDILDENPSYDIYYFKELQEFKDEDISHWIEVDSPAVTIHGKVYRKDFIIQNNIEHLKDIRFSEDTLFNLNCIINNPKVLALDRIVYLTCFNPNSSSNKDWDYFIRKASFDHCKGCIELAEMYKDKSTAVFNILVKSLLDFEDRVKKDIDITTAVNITIYIISKIIKNINKNEIECEDILPLI